MGAQIEAHHPTSWAQEWYPLRLTTTIRPLVHGGRALSEALGRTNLPRWSIAESWEVCDSPTSSTYVTNGRYAGWSIHDLVQRHPRSLLGAPHAWRFPLFAKFLDATGTSPLQLDLPADTSAPPRATAWHVLVAPPGTVARCGVRRGVDQKQLHEALVDQDFDAVMRSIPIRPGSTICIPEGTLYSFGPGTLLYAVAPSAVETLSAARWHDGDGSTVGYREWQESVTAILGSCDLASTPMAHSGLPLRRDDDVDRVQLSSFPELVLERWQVASGASVSLPEGGARVLTNVGQAFGAHVGVGTLEEVGSARTLLLPAALDPVHVAGPADLLLTWAGNGSDQAATPPDATS